MGTIDFKKEMKHLYSPSAKLATVVDVPEMQFLMIDGAGDPNNSVEFEAAIGVLYGIAYTIKFTLKKAASARKPDFVVPPLEGLWWMKGGKRFDQEKRADWRWTLMLRQPDFVTRKDVSSAISHLKEKKPSPPLGKVRFEQWIEGLCVQILHVGPYSEERPALELLDTFARDGGLSMHGKHHEIYLSAPPRCTPERMKTVLRHPVK